MVTLPLECTIDIKPFVYAKDDLKRMGEDKIEYAWKTEELVSWDWNEEVWSQRLIQHEITGVNVVPAFLWKPNSFQAEISTICEVYTRNSLSRDDGHFANWREEPWAYSSSGDDSCMLC